MEWNHGSRVNDVVPKEEEQPGSWIERGINSSKTFGSPNKYYFNERDPLREDLHYPLETFGYDLDMDLCFLDGENSSGSGISYDPIDYDLASLEEIDPTQDIFFNSSLRENVNGWCSSAPESTSDTFQTESLVLDTMLDSQDGSVDFYDMGSSKRQKTLAYSPFTNEENDEWNSHIFPCNSGEVQGFPPLMAPAEYLVPVAPYMANGEVDQRVFLEEFIMNEFQDLMEQMTKETRVLLRDAFYRLANRFKEGDSVIQSVNGAFMVGEILRSERGSKPTEPETETNGIDRVVASMMYKHPSTIAQDVVSATMMYQHPSTKAQDVVASTVSLVDAQVPICGTQDASINTRMQRFLGQ